MTFPNPSTALAHVVMEELVRAGVEVVALSPGSRSAALAIAASQHPDLECVVFLDERSASFFALGRAKATGAPAAAVSTSGTAPANWFPAVIEADASCAPLVLISADRPQELRGVGANQTIDQVELFGNKVRGFVDVPAPDGSDQGAAWRERIAGALSVAGGRDNRPGPVHLNLAFREPTVPVSDDGRSRADPYEHAVDHGEERTRRESVSPGASLEVPVDPGQKGLVITGDGSYDRNGLLEAAAGLGWPVLATALSGMRGMQVVSTYHHLVGHLPDRMTPDVVVAVGAVGPSPALDTLIGRARLRIRVDRWGRSIDPERNATHKSTWDPVALLTGLRLGGDPDSDWSALWYEADRSLRKALGDHLEGSGSASGPGVAWALDQVDRGCLVVASSLPIRDIDAMLATPGPVVANRGVSGIDGFISTALGVASALPRTLAMAGDLSLFHDSNGWINDGALDLTVVVVNNGGGGLFDLLPQAAHAPDYERLFLTPSGREIADLAALHRVEYSRVESAKELVDEAGAALDRGALNLIEVPVDRTVDLEVRAELGAVAASVVENS